MNIINKNIQKGIRQYKLGYSMILPIKPSSVPGFTQKSVWLFLKKPSLGKKSPDQTQIVPAGAAHRGALLL
ncbi:hypothetical protein C1G86_0713 [Dehalococcoides mccartyi]|uniref:Uncharacterized protein n=1 Tax=Dehalococcoides mccartyi TaxID=61435 RepID=A0A328EUC0_9CHLR|nr:hypothetical protein C1G86_0713 [Dehalococcoides mccartyi]